MSLRVPTFSILCAAYQAEDTIGRAVRSVLAQTISDWELIVCDDGSIDGTGQTALQAAHGDSRVAVIRQDNAGPGAARNTAAAEARGEYYCILDSDDEMLPDYLASMESLIEKCPDRDIYSCNARVIDPGGTESIWDSSEAGQGASSLTLSHLLERNRIFVMATLRAETFAKVDGFDESSAVEDYDLWLKILAAGGTQAYTPDVLGVYHRRADATSASAADQWHATSRLLLHYARDESLSAHERDTAARSARHYEAMAKIAQIDPEAKAHTSRTESYAMLAAYEGLSKRAAGAALITLSPRLFARVVATRRKEALESRYGNRSGAGL